MRASDFFRLLYPLAPDETWLTIWESQKRQTYCFPATWEGLESAARKAVELDATGVNVYFGLGLRKKELPPEKRGTWKEVVAIPGFWAEVDCKGGCHAVSDERLPGKDEAKEFLLALPVPPSLIVDSGGGLHAYWLFNEPWVLPDGPDGRPDFCREDAALQSERFQKALKVLFTARGWHLDSTADLARALRVPGTHNRKDPKNPRLVQVIHHADKRYTQEDLGRWVTGVLLQDEKRQKPESPVNDDDEKPDANVILEKCAFLRHCRDDAATLSEPEWYAMLTVIARTDGGPELCHELSRPYPRYSERETDQKIKHALEDTGPLTCARIRQDFGEWCRVCPYDVTSPILLGRRFRDPLAGTPYLVHQGALAWSKLTRDGEIIVPLCNFTARVVRDVARDDGAEETRLFEIEGRLATGRTLPRITVPAEKFFSMNWVMQWGVDAVISAGLGAKDRLREAIQLASRGARQERVFTHLGWRKVDGRWVYLHAGGAIGAEGVLVDPELEGLRRYVLPADGSPEEGVATSLRLLEIGPPEVTHPLWACVWRAPLACVLYPTVVLFLYGQTGKLKSTVAALFLSHFGGPFTKDNLPVSFLATENALERAAFLCRDAILVVDDYAPEKYPREAAALDRKANRLIRQVGNRATRTRCDSSVRLRPENLPNALVIATGEQLPLEVQSVGARILPVLFEEGAVNLDRLTQAQAEAHLLPQAMRGYLQWLAPQMDGLAPRVISRFEELRGRAAVEGHPRLPEAVAHLYLGAEAGVAYGLHLGALDRKRADEILRDTWEALLHLAREHAKALEEERPTVRFMKALEAIFVSGHGYLRPRLPDIPEGSFGTDGDKLGWYDSDGMYLISTAAMRTVSRYMEPVGGLPIRERTLKEQLAREGFLVTRPGRFTNAVKCEGKTMEVLHIRLDKFLEAISPSESANSANQGREASNGAGLTVGGECQPVPTGLPTGARDGEDGWHLGWHGLAPFSPECQPSNPLSDKGLRHPVGKVGSFERGNSPNNTRYDGWATEPEGSTWREEEY
jgi:hypothetical protein